MRWDLRVAQGAQGGIALDSEVGGGRGRGIGMGVAHKELWREAGSGAASGTTTDAIPWGLSASVP